MQEAMADEYLPGKYDFIGAYVRAVKRKTKSMKISLYRHVV